MIFVDRAVSRINFVEAWRCLCLTCHVLRFHLAPTRDRRRLRRRQCRDAATTSTDAATARRRPTRQRHDNDARQLPTRQRHDDNDDRQRPTRQQHDDATTTTTDATTATTTTTTRQRENDNDWRRDNDNDRRDDGDNDDSGDTTTTRRRRPTRYLLRSVGLLRLKGRVLAVSHNKNPF